MTDEEELAALNGGDEAELAKLNSVPRSEPAKAPAPKAEEQSFWQKAGERLGGVGDAITTNARAGLNGISWGLAPKAAARLESIGGTVAHGLMPSEFEEGKSYDEALKEYLPKYEAASKAFPVTDFAASLLTGGPEVKGLGLMGKAASTGAQSMLQSAGRVYGRSQDGLAESLNKGKGEIGLSALLGGLFGAGAHGASKLATKGEDMAARAVEKNAAQTAKEAEAAKRSAGRAVGVESTAAHTVLANAREAAENPNLSPEEVKRAKDFLASEYAKHIADKANRLNVERGMSAESAIDRATKSREEVFSKYSPEGMEAISAERLARPEMLSGIKEIAKRVAPTAIGGGLGYLMGHDAGSVAAMGGLGALVGALKGKEGRIIINRFNKPAFQKSLSDTMSRVGDTASDAASSSTSVAPRAALTLADYFSSMKDDQ